MYPFNKAQLESIISGLQDIVAELYEQGYEDWLYYCLQPIPETDISQIVTQIDSRELVSNLHTVTSHPIPDEVQDNLIALSTLLGTPGFDYEKLNQSDKDKVATNFKILEKYPNYNPANIVELTNFEREITSTGALPEIIQGLVRIREAFLGMTPKSEYNYTSNPARGFSYRAGTMPFGLDRVSQEKPSLEVIQALIAGTVAGAISVHRDVTKVKNKVISPEDVKKNFANLNNLEKMLKQYPSNKNRVKEAIEALLDNPEIDKFKLLYLLVNNDYYINAILEDYNYCIYFQLVIERCKEFNLETLSSYEIDGNNLLAMVNTALMNWTKEKEEHDNKKQTKDRIAKLLIERTPKIKTTPSVLNFLIESEELTMLAIKNGLDVFVEVETHTPLLAKILERGSFELAKCAIENLPDEKINVKMTEHGFTCLHEATTRKNSELVNLLLKRNADPIAKDNEGRTPLHYAAAMGNFEAVKLLLKKYDESSIKDNEGKTPLHYAFTAEDSDTSEDASAEKIFPVIATLLEKVDINLEDSQGYTAMQLAVAKQRMDIVKYVQEHIPPDETSNSSLEYLLKKCRFDEARKLIEETDISKVWIDNKSLLVWLFNKYKGESGVEDLVLGKSDNADISIINLAGREEPLLAFLVRWNKYSLAEQAMKKGANVNIEVNYSSGMTLSLLDSIDVSKAPQLVKLALECGARIISSEHLRQPFILRILSQENIELVELAIVKGADIDQGYSIYESLCRYIVEDSTPQNLLIRDSYLHLLDLVLKHDRNNTFPIDYAISKQKIDEIELYFKNGGRLTVFNFERYLVDREFDFNLRYIELSIKQGMRANSFIYWFNSLWSNLSSEHQLKLCEFLLKNGYFIEIGRRDLDFIINDKTCCDFFKKNALPITTTSAENLLRGG